MANLNAALAASDDNVRTLALLACERFGATLAISSFSHRKIEAMIRKQATRPVQKFLLAKIGYAKGGSMTALSNSAEGISLAQMIMDTADNRPLSPIVYQLKDLLDILEPRLNTARFLDEVEGYQALILRSQNQAGTAKIAVPSPDVIQVIVESFRELSRLGNADVRSLKFTVGPFAAWVSAFASWSVEVPPLICDDQNQALVDQPDSKVTICISSDVNIREVVSAVVGSESKPILASGMVSLETHGSLSLKELGFDHGLGKRRIFKHSLMPSIFSGRPLAGRDVLGTFNFETCKASKNSMIRFLNPFPDEDIIAAVMKIYLGLDDTISLQRLEDGLEIGDLPLVRLWTKEHKDFLERNPED